MNVTSTPTGNVSSRLNVNISANDYNAEVDKRLKEIGRKRQIPGFRVGHAPLSALRRMFGRQVTSDVINDKVYNAVTSYLRDNKVAVLGQPMPVEVKEFDPDAEEHEFAYDLALAPEINVTVDKDIHVPYYTIKVEESMIDDEDKALRKRFGSQVPGDTVEPDAVVKGGLMQLNDDGSVNENEGAVQVVNGVVYPALFKDPEQAKLFEGHKVGDKVRFNPWKTCGGNPTEMASMLNLDKDIAADVHSDFEMAISEIIVVRPAELNEEYYANTFGKEVTDEKQYREAIKGMIARQLAGNSENLFRRDAQKAIMDKVGKMELADDLLKRWFAMSNEELSEQDAAESYDRMRPMLEWELVSDRVAQQLGVQITEDDMTECAVAMTRQQFAQYGMLNLSDDVYTEYAKKMLADEKMRRNIAEQVAAVKLYTAIKGAVTLDTKEVTLDEFRKIAAAD